MLNELKNLSAVVNSLVQKVDNIKSTELAEIKSEVKTVTSKLTSIENRLNASEKRIDDLESKVNAISTSPVGPNVALSPELVLAELNDRNSRASNIIVYNLPEASANNEAAAKLSDNDLLVKLISTFATHVNTSNLKTYRLGGPQSKKPRPIKVVLENPSDVNKFFSSLDTAKAKEVDPLLSEISVSRDKTPREREYLSSLRTELDDRTKAGERNLTIKYKNGIPQIVKKQSKN